ncbi:MAG: RpiB/LacA/LacB family sugar-phosphate isomerase [Patescibacteria group bacterium]
MVVVFLFVVVRIGVCITANKVKGIRAGIGYKYNVSKSMRNDNDTNILCLAADNLSEDFAMVITKNWLTTDFSNHPRFYSSIKKNRRNRKIIC